MTFSITDSNLCEKETLSSYKERIVILDLALVDDAAIKLVNLFETNVNERELFFYAHSCIKDQTKVSERIQALTGDFEFDYGLSAEAAVWLSTEVRAQALSIFRRLALELMVVLRASGAYRGNLLHYEYLGCTPSGSLAIFAKPPCRHISPPKTISTRLLSLTPSSR